MKYSEVIPELIKKVPELKPLYEDHLETYDELIPHPFMGEVAFFVGDKLQDTTPPKEGAANLATVKKILEFLEGAMSSTDPRVPELVAVSFLEVLDPEQDYYPRLKKLLGKKMSASLKELETE